MWVAPRGKKSMKPPSAARAWSASDMPWAKVNGDRVSRLMASSEILCMDF